MVKIDTKLKNIIIYYLKVTLAKPALKDLNNNKL